MPAVKSTNRGLVKGSGILYRELSDDKAEKRQAEERGECIRCAAHSNTVTVDPAMRYVSARKAFILFGRREVAVPHKPKPREDFFCSFFYAIIYFSALLFIFYLY